MNLSLAVLAEQDQRDPWWRVLNDRRERQRAKVGAIAFVEHFDRCPECMAQQASEYAAAQVPFDAARDRDLLRRDVAEIYETIALELLSSPTPGDPA